MRKRLISILSMLALLLSVCGSASAQERVEVTPLEVYFFDAGKADAILITTQSGAILLDCGCKGFGQTILDELSARGIEALDYLIITHFDKDHVGGAAKVINNFPVKTVLQSNSPKDSEEYEKYIKALNNANLEAVTVREDREFTLDGITFTVNPPRKSNYINDDSNNSSLIVTVVNGDDILLFLGDAQTERLEEYLEAGPVDCDFLKVAHHGGEEPLIDALVASVRPELAVITCSEDEPESDAIRQSLENAGTALWLTRVAPVSVTSNGENVTVTYEG